MKTKIFKSLAIAAVIGLFSSTAFAQITHGPVAGVNIANLSGDSTDDPSSLISFHAGWFVNLDVTENITIQPQLLYSGKGAKSKLGDKEIPFALNYIEIPIWGRYNLESGLHFDFGPYIGFLMGAKVDGESEFTFGTQTVKYKDSYKSTDFGVGFGLGYELESGLGFAANYNLGLSNISDTENGDLKNNVIKVSVSYTLGK